ncbi:hypothetical protein [Lentzea sp.]|uniref:hypothetical protein n=1 Tax=Lentzea sp. TaxID=56099 RepID=UPI002C4C2421|nr:hypothetical protein [Lentzea sp.]HUQ57775.1 hypothetical protein [Lentzea sp.]
MVLSGRLSEVAAVDQLLDLAAAGRGGHLVISGPPGSGRTAIADAAADRARARGLRVVRTARAVEVMASGAPDGGEPGLLIVEDLELARQDTAEVARRLASQAQAGVAVLVTASDPVGVPPEIRLGGLAEHELGALVPTLPENAVHALWLASGGLPGRVLELARHLAGLGADADPVAHLALTARSRAGFLEADLGLIRLLEAAAAKPAVPTVRARVLARLARELLGDASAAARRCELSDEALSLAREVGDAGTIADVLDSRLHALWDPAAADERLEIASEIVDQARLAGDGETELRGLFWRFVALMELGRTDGAEAALTTYARAAEQAGNAEAAVVVLARQAVLATMRGRFAEAEVLVQEASTRGQRIGLSDTERLVGSLRSAIALLRGDLAGLVAPWQTVARRLPGHFYEAMTARLLVLTGSPVEAGLELERMLPTVLAGSGPRWLGAVADLSVVAARVGDPEAAQALYTALKPYTGRLVVRGGASIVTGPVDDYLALLALRLGLSNEAVTLLDSAVELEQRIGALPWLAHTLAARADALTARGADEDARSAADDRAMARSIAERLGLDGFVASLAPPAGTWHFLRDGDDWRLEAGAERARLRHTRGMSYLRALLTSPGHEIEALDLVSGGPVPPAPVRDTVLDAIGRTSYRQHLTTLDEQLDAADRAGDTDRSAALTAERTALLAELRRNTGLGGRSRARTDEMERARVNATRALQTALVRIEAVAPLAGAHLRASLRTGTRLVYRPVPGSGIRWTT